jgi:hypothetical protein
MLRESDIAIKWPSGPRLGDLTYREKCARAFTPGDRSSRSSIGLSHRKQTTGRFTFLGLVKS